MLYAHAHLPPPSLRERRPGLPEAVYAAIDAALAKDPQRRPSSAGDFAAAFAAAVASPRTNSAPAPPTPLWSRGLVGDGAQSVSLWLAAGLTTFRFSYTAGGLFRLQLLDRAGRLLKQLVETRYPYRGTTAHTVSEAGEYAIAVAAQGAWSGEVEQPLVATQPAVSEASGSGDDVVFLMLPVGVARLLITHHVWHGTHFRVTLLDAHGEHADPLVTSAGHYQGIVPRRIERGGTYALVIEAEGRWSVVVR